jgi:isoquinoline 1-oxidoreductase beta subunit
MTGKWTRRAFIVGGATLGGLAGGLAVGIGYLASIDLKGRGGRTLANGSVLLNSYIEITPTGVIRFAIPRTEMGQGVQTAQAMLLAEELGVSLTDVTVFHPLQLLPVYSNFAAPFHDIPEHHTGPRAWVIKHLFGAVGFVTSAASSTTMDAWIPLRAAAAAAREMLIAAAVARSGIPAGDWHSDGGFIIDRERKIRLPFAALAAEASKMTPPGEPKLKPPEDWTLIGHNLPRLDTPSKVDGSARYGIDSMPEDVLYAAVAMPSGYGRKMASADTRVAEKIPGVIKVLSYDTFVAVIASSWWSARQAAKAINVQAVPSAWDGFGTVEFAKTLNDRLASSGASVVLNKGDAQAALAHAERRVDAQYYSPPMTHACMEPMNATARYDPQTRTVDLWCGTQSPFTAKIGVHRGAARNTAPLKNVNVNVTYAGCGFGRRGEHIEIEMACACATAMPGRPVKLIWTREQDIQNGFLRAPNASRFSARLGADGLPDAWSQHVATQSLAASYSRRVLGLRGIGNNDHMSLDGALQLHYAIANLRVEMTNLSSPLSIGFLRSNAQASNVGFGEAFLDECAQIAGIDPLEYRLRLLKDDSRAARTLRAVADLAAWGSAQSGIAGRGLAWRRLFNSDCAVIVDVASASSGGVRIKRVTCAVDVGAPINPRMIEQQVESAIIFALSMALYQKIDIEKGVVSQSNFGDFPLLTLRECPDIDVVVLPSTGDAGGLGELAVGAAVGALLNGVSAAAGRRIRRLPIVDALSISS